MSPFEIFRRNLKPAMVVLVGLSMFAFVVLPAMDTYLRSGYSGGADQKIAEIDGIDVSQSRVEYFTRNHQTTVRFLRDMAEETIRRGGAPQTPGFAFDTRSNQVQQVGINDRPSEFGSVRTMQLAAEATKAGFELDDTAIKSWLSKYTDGTMTDSEILGLLAKTSRNSMGQFHLYEQLRTQLLATVYQNSGASGLVTKQQQALMTPTQQWASFLKLNRQATVNAYGLMVQDFYEQTEATPASAKIQAVYDEGKERYPNRQSPEPAFRKRESATFEFVAADMKSFIDREVEKLSDEEIRAEYDKQLKGGAFTMPDNSIDDILKQAEEMKAEVEAKAAEEKASPEGDAAEEADDKGKDEDGENKDAAKPESKDDKPVEAPAAEMKADQDAEVKTADAKEPTDEANSAGAKDAGGQDADLKKQVEDFEKEIEAAKDSAKDSAEETDAGQSSMQRRNGVRLVSFQDDEKDAENTKAEETADDAKAESPAGEKNEEAKSDAVDAEAKENTAEESAAGEMKEDAPSEKEKEADVADEKEDEKTETEDEKSEDETPKVQPFEEVRQQVAESMVRVKAGEALSDAIAKSRAAMRLYFNKKAIYDSNQSIGQEGEAPVKPDLEKMAADLGLVYGKIGPHDIASIVDEPIANSVELGTSLRDRGPPFTAMMFGMPYMGQELPKQQLYSPLGTVDTQAQRSYMTWKIAEKEAYVPELDEVKEEVVRAIRMAEARDLARAAADKLLEQGKEGKKLADLVPEDKKFNYFEGLGPFSWMQSFGFGGAFLGNVPKLDSVGEEFMEKVFSTEISKLGAAANLPERVIYIVEPTEFQPSIDDLRERFKQPRERMMASMLGNEDAGTVYQGFFESTDKRTGFSYQSPDAAE